MDAKFLGIVEKTIFHETSGDVDGAYHFDPEDPGGETKWGISKKQYPYIDIKTLTRDQAVSVYYMDFWLTPKMYRIDDGSLCQKVFDIGVNISPYRAIKFLQEAVNLFIVEEKDKLVVDGILGTRTSFKVNGYKYPKALESAFEIFAGSYYINQKKTKYLAGWLIRLDE